MILNLPAVGQSWSYFFFDELREFKIATLTDSTMGLSFLDDPHRIVNHCLSSFAPLAAGGIHSTSWNLKK